MDKKDLPLISPDRTINEPGALAAHMQLVEAAVDSLHGKSVTAERAPILGSALVDAAWFLQADPSDLEKETWAQAARNFVWIAGTLSTCSESLLFAVEKAIVERKTTGGKMEVSQSDIQFPLTDNSELKKSVKSALEENQATPVIKAGRWLGNELCDAAFLMLSPKSQFQNLGVRIVTDLAPLLARYNEHRAFLSSIINGMKERATPQAEMTSIQ